MGVQVWIAHPVASWLASSSWLYSCDQPGVCGSPFRSGQLETPHWNPTRKPKRSSYSRHRQPRLFLIDTFHDWQLCGEEEALLVHGIAQRKRNRECVGGYVAAHGHDSQVGLLGFDDEGRFSE